MLKAVLTLFVLVAVAVGGAPPAGAQGQEAPAAPFLRIETGLHTARINRIATDASGRLVATVSHDKTVRLWSRDSGEPVGVLRIPMDRGEEGRLYAVALSPDGETAVAAGYTAASWDGAVALYVFDVRRQRMIGRLPGQPNVVYDLAYSPDGKYVAAVFGGTAGLRVYDGRSFAQVAQDQSYGARATGLAFDPRGRLATVSDDGQVRLYDGQFKLVRKAAMAPKGRLPSSVAFSADGSRLAVGYTEALQVDVLSGTDLKKQYGVKTDGLARGGLSAVAWLGSGPAETLAAGGTASADGKQPLLRLWADGGRGAARDLPVSRNLITHLRADGDGGLLFAAADPVWGRLDGQGQPVLNRRSVVGDFRDIYRGRFGVSADGLTVEFGMEPNGLRPFRFDVMQRELTADPAADAGIVGPRETVGDLAVTDWRNSVAPKVNGKPVRLEDAERALSADVTPDGKRALIGSDFALRLVDGQGRVQASVQAPAEVWGVVASGDGRLAVAALGDGTLRWYSLDGGVRPLEELAVLFPHGGGRQWVLWTPEALFDHSDDGGQELVGFHFNTTKKAAPQWVEFKRVYEVLFNREMVRDRLRQVNREALAKQVQRIGDLRTLTQRAPKLTLVDYCVVPRDTRGFSRVAPANQPGAVASVPVETCRPIDTSPLTRAFSRVSAAAPAAATTEAAAAPRSVLDLPGDTGAVRIRYKLEAAGDGIGDVQVFHNDRDVTGSGTRGFSRVAPAAAPAAPAAPEPQDLREALVRVEPGANRITLRAYNSNGAIYEQSPVVEFALAAPTRAAEPAEPPPPPAKPRLIYTVAGIDAYRPPFPKLQRAASDARTFAATLRERLPDAYDAAESLKLSRELYDAAASRDALVEALRTVARQAREEDTVVIYLAGHGLVDPVPDDNVDLYYYITQNVAAGDVPTVARDALSERDLMELLRDIPAKNKVLLLDTCHSGAVQALAQYPASKIEKFKERVGRGPYILAAAAGDQTALDSSADRSRSGPFARAVIEALAEAKGQPGETVDQIQLARHIRAKVPVYAQQDRWNQTAVVSFGGGDVDFFPIATIK